jgi:hypothetical protein
LPGLSPRDPNIPKASPPTGRVFFRWGDLTFLEATMMIACQHDLLVRECEAFFSCLYHFYLHCSFGEGKWSGGGTFVTLIATVSRMCLNSKENTYFSVNERYFLIVTILPSNSR